MKVSEITVQKFSRANNDKIKERFPLNSKFQQVKITRMEKGILANSNHKKSDVAILITKYLRQEVLPEIKRATSYDKVNLPRRHNPKCACS